MITQIVKDKSSIGYCTYRISKIVSDLLGIEGRYVGNKLYCNMYFISGISTPWKDT